jgi:hypothetical protein
MTEAVERLKLGILDWVGTDWSRRSGVLQRHMCAVATIATRQHLALSQKPTSDVRHFRRIVLKGR